MYLDNAFNAPANSGRNYLGVEPRPWSPGRPPATGIRSVVTHPGRPPASLLTAVRNMRVMRRAGQPITPLAARTLIARIRRAYPALYANVARQARDDGMAGLGDSLFDRILDTVDKVGDTVEKFEPIWSGPAGSPTSTPTAKLGTGNANSPGAQRRPPPRRPAVVQSGAWMPIAGMAAALAVLVMWSK